MGGIVPKPSAPSAPPPPPPPAAEPKDTGLDERSQDKARKRRGRRGAVSPTLLGGDTNGNTLLG